VRLRRSRSALAVALLVAPWAVVPARAQATGGLAIVTTPAGAEVRIDGSPVGRAPTTSGGLLPGEHLIEAVWPDGASASTVATVTSGVSAVVQLTSAGSPPPPTPPPSTPEGPPPGPAPLNVPVPMQTGDASGATAETRVVIPDLVRSPFHPQRRRLTGISVAPGLFCPSLDTVSTGPSDWCAFQMRLAMDWFIGDLHIKLLAGQAIQIGMLLGGEIGSPYFQLGGPTSPFAIAARASVDLLVTKKSDDYPQLVGDGLLGLANTYGPNLSFAVTQRFAVEARLGLGFLLAAPFGTIHTLSTVNGRPFTGTDSFGSTRVEFLTELWMGVRLQP
jgi:hypothetical protein